LENGRGTSEFDSENDALKDYLFTRPSTLGFNAIDIHRPDFSQAYDVQSTTSDGDDDSVTTAIPSGVTSSKTDKDHEFRCYSLILSNPLPILDNGRATSEFDSHVLCDPVPILGNGRGTSEFDSESDNEFDSEGDNDSVTTAIPSGVASSKTNRAHNVEDNVSDIVPKSVGKLHVPVPNSDTDANRLLATPSTSCAVAIANDPEFDAIDTLRLDFSQCHDVQSTTSDGDDAPVTTAIPSVVASSKTNKAHNVEDDTRKLASNLIRGTYIGCTDGEQVLNEEGTERILQQPYEDKVAELYVKLAPEKRFDASRFRKDLLEHDYNVYNPDALDAEHTPALVTNHLRVPASHLYPDVDFSEQNGSSDELALCINALSSRAVTVEEAVLGSFTRRKLKTLSNLRVPASHLYPDVDFSEQNGSSDELALCIYALSSRAVTVEEAVLGSFTRRKLKTLSTRHEWQAGEFKQLDRLHALPFAIELFAMEGQPVLLLRQVDDFALACSNEDTANRIYGTFGERLKLEHIPVAPFERFGLLPAYNGVDVN
jgi:hypothetical protein